MKLQVRACFLKLHKFFWNILLLNSCSIYFILFHFILRVPSLFDFNEQDLHIYRNGNVHHWASHTMMMMTDKKP